MIIFSSLCLLHLWIIAIISLITFKKNNANLFFGIFLILFSSIHIQHLLLQTGYISSYPYTDPLCGVTICLCFPAYYFYVKSLCGTFSFKDKKQYIHLFICIPAIINLTYLLIFKSPEDLYEYYYKENYSYTLQNALLLAGMCSLLIFYIWLSNKEIQKYNMRLKDNFSEIEKLKLDWLSRLNLFLLILAFIITPVLILLGKQDWNFAAIGTYTSIIYVYILYKSFNSEIINTSFVFVTEPNQNIVEPIQKLSKERETEIISILEEYLNNKKPWLSPELSLKQVAGETMIPSYQLSYVINKNYNKSFFDLINQLRIKQVIVKLTDPSEKFTTLEAIAEDCGFGSKATFNRAFKKETGTTPSHYRKEQKLFKEEKVNI